MSEMAIFVCEKCGARVGCNHADYHGQTTPFSIECLCEGNDKPRAMGRVKGSEPQKLAAGPTGLVLMVDANNYIHTYWAANPENTRLVAAQGLVDCLTAFKNRYKAIRVIVAFDGDGKTFRHEAYKEYKSNRGPRDPGLVEQLNLAKKLLTEAGMFVIQVDGFEADDLLATIAKRSVSRGNKVVIFSRDKDFRQLLDGQNITLLIHSTRRDGAYDFTFYSRKEYDGFYEFPPERFVDYLALSGDGSDCWPGVEGVGDKTARELLKAFGNMDEIVKAAKGMKENGTLDDRIKPRLVDRLAAFDCDLGRVIVKLRTDVPLPKTQPAKQETAQ